VILPDVNVLVYAHREEFPRHALFRAWLEDLIGGEDPYALAAVILAGFVRIVTNPRVFDRASTMDDALAFTTVLREQPNCVWIGPDSLHWNLFETLCRQPGIKGGLVTDAYIAALAIEHRCVLATEDGDFQRFQPRLSTVSPLVRVGK